MDRIHLNETISTNTYFKEMLQSGAELPGCTIADADFQTSGRGQAGNVWESKKGENLLFSILCHPRMVEARNQFLLSQVIALAVWNTLDDLIEGVSIKWPNDIYWDEKKICGILIECDLVGSRIENCICGVGLNINQTQFESDAPNPVSLAQIVGFSFDREKILNGVIGYFEKYYSMLEEGKEEEIRSTYKAHLFRKDGFFPFAEIDGEMFEAEIQNVEPDGLIILKDRDGKTRKYEFKQIKWILNT